MTMPEPVPVGIPLVAIPYDPTRVAGHALTRAQRQLDEAERNARTNPPRSVILAARAARTAMVAVLIAHGAHVADGADTTLAQAVRELGLPVDAARAFTDVRAEVDHVDVTRDASVALAGARVVISATASLVTGPATPLR